MADSGGRTPAEREAARQAREAARRERERRRAEHEPAARQPDFASGGDGGLETWGADGGLETRAMDGESEVGEHQVDGGSEVGEHHGDGGPEVGEHHGDGGLETSELELEAPSGTRRVSHRETLAGSRPGERLSSPRKPRHRQRRRPPLTGRGLWFRRAASVLALLIAGALAWFLIQLFEPFPGSPHGHVTVQIRPRESSSRIGDLLAREGVISSSFFFELRATLAGERADLRPGTYHLQLGMSYGAVLAALTKVPPAGKVTDVTIIEGRNRQEVNALLRAQHVRGSYLAATRRSPLLSPRRYGGRGASTLEGFLFPDTYQLVEPISILALVADQLRTFKQKFATVDLSYARRRRLTPYDVLTIASLIEGEAATPHDALLVASVIYNRLADGIMLGLDSTTRFATGNLTAPLTDSQLHSRSPYNTRTHLGLPPGPIDSPGLAAIRAAAKPARTRYLYFFARPCGGPTVFATSYTQFLNLVARYRRNHC